MRALQRVLFFGLLGTATIGCTAGNDDEIDAPGTNTQSTRRDTTATTDEPFILEEGFTQLTLDDFHAFPESQEQTKPIWTSPDSSTLLCSGLERGYAYTQKSYRNFTLRLDFRYLMMRAHTLSDGKPNTGFLIYMPEEHKVWPASLEVQGRQDEMGQIKSNSRDIQVVVMDNEQARVSSRKRLMEWNSIEIVSRDGALTSYLNGTKICESQPTELIKGSIGLQSEGFEVEFRRIRIRED